MSRNSVVSEILTSYLESGGGLVILRAANQPDGGRYLFCFN